jgi:hypothetical protein
MTPECPRCASTSTRRRPRIKSIGHRLMFFLGMYPWECLNCQRHFFHSTRYSQSRRHAQGEVYTGPNRPPDVRPGSRQSHN